MECDRGIPAQSLPARGVDGLVPLLDLVVSDVVDANVSGGMGGVGGVF